MVRATRERLTRERVVDTAIALADEGGLAAVSMRAVAVELEVAPMALYRHVSDKADLVSGMIDAVVAGYPTPTATDWRAVIRFRSLAARAAVQRHPWLRPAIETASTKTPAVLGYLDAATGDLLGSGISPDLAHHAMHAIGCRIWGFSPEGFDGEPLPAADEPAPEPDRAALAARYPHIAAVVGDSLARRGGCDPDAEFAITLDLLLDGVQRLHESGWVSG